MKLKRYVAADMREALSKIKEDLGPEAVIMSNKRVPEGVEIVAGIEPGTPEPAPVRPQGGRRATMTAQALKDDGPLSRYLKDDEVSLGRGRGNGTGAKTTVGGKNSENFAQSLMEILARQKAGQTGQEPEPPAAKPAAAAPREAPAKPQAAAQKPQRRTPPKPLDEQSGYREIFGGGEKKAAARRQAEKEHGISSYREGVPESAMHEVRRDVDEIKRLLQFELAGLIRDSRVREQPVRAMTAQLLGSAGFSEKVAADLTSAISADASFNFAWRELSDIMARAIKVGNDEIIREGGVVALIGPAGVGKTTTLAKLAARFVMNYGPEKVAIVTADHYRIGAVEQVRTYGRIMGCGAFSVNSLGELPEMLMSLRDRSLVLIDTAGVGFKDERFAAQLTQLKMHAKLKLKHYLVLPATAQRRVLEQAYRHFSQIRLDGLMLTKIDESQSLGDALSLCIEHGMRLSYTTDGQRVPEDLQVPVAGELTRLALSVLENETVQSVFDR